MIAGAAINHGLPGTTARRTDLARAGADSDRACGLGQPRPSSRSTHSAGRRDEPERPAHADPHPGARSQAPRVPSSAEAGHRPPETTALKRICPRAPMLGDSSSGPAPSVRLGSFRLAQFPKQRLRILEMAGQNLSGQLKDLEGPGVLDAVKDARPLAATLQQSLPAQCAKVLRSPAGVDLERRLQVTDGALTITQQLKNPNPDRVAKNLEELGLHAMDRLRASICEHRSGLAHERHRSVIGSPGSTPPV